MMEKYGTDLSELPVDDDQIRLLKDLCVKTGKIYSMPKNKKEAEEKIEELEKLASEEV